MDNITDRIEKLKEQAAALAFETAPEVAPFDELLRSGITLPPPDELDDDALEAKLWEVIHGLKGLGVYLDFTDHLSDRQLYTRLWSTVLREPMALTPDDLDAGWHIDLSAGDEDDVFLTYYADEDVRRRWADDDPEYAIPESQPLPFDRDRHLPSQWAHPASNGDDDVRMS
jgi:hypothetical protein